MPSIKNPSSLEVGPGRLSANVVSASSLTAPTPSAPVESSPPAVISVFATQTLTREGPNTIVLVDARPYISAIAGASLVDGQTFTLNDGVTSTVFEFDSNATVTPGRIAVAFTPGDTAEGVADAIRIAVASSGAGFDAVRQGRLVRITNTDIYKPVVISETVANAGFTFRSSTGTFTITFPSIPAIGDTITFIESTPNFGSVSLAGGGLHEESAPERLTGGFGSRTFVCSDEFEGWIATAEKPGIQTVNANTTLIRAGMQHLVLCDTSTAPATVTLPANCLVGDKVTVVLVAGANDLTIDGAGADTIDGLSDAVIQGGSTTGAFMTFLCVAAGLSWITLERSQVVVEVTSSFSSTSDCRDLVVLCHTADPAWNFGVVNLQSGARPGDLITVIDVDGNPDEAIRLQPAVTLNGINASVDIRSPYMAVTVRHVSGGNWVIQSQSNYTQARILTTNSLALVRTGGLFTVAVRTADSSWTDADNITLPAAPMIGDIVVVTDAEGEITNESLSVRKTISVIPAGAATINGVSAFRIGGGYGSAMFLYARSDSWVTVGYGAPQNAVYNVFSASVTLPRIGPNVLVRVNPGGGGWDATDIITLPTDAILGDRITICQVNTGDSADQIRVQPGAGNTFNGYLAEYSIPLHTGTVPNVGHSGVATFLKAATGLWIVEGQFGPNEIISANNDLNLTRTSANMTVRVNTAAGTWDGTVDRITLPSTGAGQATPGDKVTIFDSDGQAAASTKSIVVDGGTINGVSTFPIDWAFGAATFILGPAGTWTSAGHGGPGRLLRRVIRSTAGSGTHNLLATTRSFRVYGMGPGAGGAGCIGDSTGACAAGSGPSGGLFDHIFSVVTGVSSFTWEIGAGGAGGVGITPSGSGSAPTQVTYNSVTVGGRAGPGTGAGSPDTDVPAFRTNGVTQPAVVGTPDLAGECRGAGIGIVLDLTHVTSGEGGRNFFGAFARGATTNNGLGAAGFDGTFGGGGSGGVAGSGTSGNRDGGNGGDGILIVEEYS